MKMNKHTVHFLLLNGFEKVHSLAYKNNKCTVSEHKDYYVIQMDIGTMYTKDLSIYSLIGILTYKGLMDKNYNQNG